MSSKVDYWIVKGFWGKKWGEDGFFYVRMGEGGGIGLEDGVVFAKPVTPYPCTVGKQVCFVRSSPLVDLIVSYFGLLM